MRAPTCRRHLTTEQRILVDGVRRVVGAPLGRQRPRHAVAAQQRGAQPRERPCREVPPVKRLVVSPRGTGRGAVLPCSEFSQGCDSTEAPHLGKTAAAQSAGCCPGPATAAWTGRRARAAGARCGGRAEGCGRPRVQGMQVPQQDHACAYACKAARPCAHARTALLHAHGAHAPRRVHLKLWPDRSSSSSSPSAPSAPLTLPASCAPLVAAGPKSRATTLRREGNVCSTRACAAACACTATSAAQLLARGADAAMRAHGARMDSACQPRT